MADYDMTQNRTASNYAIQPGKSVDYPSPGTPMDPADHPATNMPTATQHYDGSQDGGFAAKYMRGMQTLASGTSKSAGQYGAEDAQSSYNSARKKVGLDD